MMTYFLLKKYLKAKNNNSSRTGLKKHSLVLHKTQFSQPQEKHGNDICVFSGAHGGSVKPVRLVYKS